MLLSALRRLWQPLEVEATLALAAGLTAALLLTHPLYFDQRPGVYGPVLSIAWLSEEWHWGAFAAVACALTTAGFAVAALARELGFALRAAGLGVGFAFWTTLAVMLAMGGALTIGSVLAGTMAVFSLRGLRAGPGETHRDG